jgi:hypothetical protein
MQQYHGPCPHQLADASRCGVRVYDAAWLHCPEHRVIAPEPEGRGQWAPSNRYAYIAVPNPERPKAWMVCRAAQAERGGTVKGTEQVVVERTISRPHAVEIAQAMGGAFFEGRMQERHWWEKKTGERG